MSPNDFFPSTVEIKRILSAVKRAGVSIGKVEIEPARIRVFAAPEPSDKISAEKAFDDWYDPTPPTLRRRR